MKVLIVSPCVNLPVPAVHGGAVSTLIEYLVKENEVEQRMQLTVLSIYDAEAEQKAKTYTRTQFDFICPPKIVDWCDHVADTVLSVGEKKKTEHQYFRKQYSLNYISRYMVEHDFDKVVFQNSGYLLNVLNNRAIAEKYKGKLYYHLHNDIPNNISVKAVMQCKLLLISEYLKKHVNEVCGQDVSEQCVIVKNGFDCDRFAQKLPETDRLELKRKVGIEPDKKVVMFAGRIAPTKGILELTEAFKRLNRDDTVLMVVGAHNFGTGQTSEFQKRMEKQFIELGKRVCFTGYVSYDEIWKYYKLADIAVLPSIWEEPAGLTMIEACAAGIPLITTRSGGIPEYVPERDVLLLDKNEKLVNSLKDAIETVLNNMPIWKKSACSAQEYVKLKYCVPQYYENFWRGIGGN